MVGYGCLIAEARRRAGLTIAELAERLGQSKSTVVRLESERTEPSVEQINALVSVLPISAEELLAAMGVSLSLPLAARLPRRLLAYLASMDPEQLERLTAFLVASKGRS